MGVGYVIGVAALFLLVLVCLSYGSRYFHKVRYRTTAILFSLTLLCPVVFVSLIKFALEAVFDIQHLLHTLGTVLFYIFPVLSFATIGMVLLEWYKSRRQAG